MQNHFTHDLKTNYADELHILDETWKGLEIQTLK
jgi:hypothetical protein